MILAPQLVEVQYLVDAVAGMEMREQNSAGDGAMEVQMYEGARAEKMSSSAATDIWIYPHTGLRLGVTREDMESSRTWHWHGGYVEERQQDDVQRVDGKISSVNLDETAGFNIKEDQTSMNREEQITEGKKNTQL
jgi:hypothetical protein